MATHRFQPFRYHTVIGAHEPVLRIADGDTVVTTTIDAGGRDALGEPVGGRPNPQTGPFYVEGAEPGDTLSVRFNRLMPNREEGYSSSRLASGVIDPDFLIDFPVHGRGAKWRIDRERKTATLTVPDTQLGRFILPLEPMLGCFGVAPEGGQAISCSTAGSHGGNMDYRGFREGVTVHLPVFVEGALFHLGDGHARQGDGEISGTGIEISFDIEFTVAIHKKARIRWPRGESDTYLFTVGNARPLDQALQHATTEMARWLRDGYSLDPDAIGILLGQCVEYEVGNVFDPAYTMVCKIRKSLVDS